MMELDAQNDGIKQAFEELIKSQDLAFRIGIQVFIKKALNGKG